MNRSTNHMDGFNPIPLRTEKVRDKDGSVTWTAYGLLNGKRREETKGHASEGDAITAARAALYDAYMSGDLIRTT